MERSARILLGMESRPSICLYVCGILTFPGHARNWTGRAVTWTHLHTPHRAEKIEYFVGPVGRVLGQRLRARKLIRTLEFYADRDWRIILAGHSNGCDVILDALRALRPAAPRIAALHLLSPACDEHFERNGLNSLADRIGSVSVWIAAEDRPLVLADSWAGRLVGFGGLGRRGPLHATCRPRIYRGPGGHSHWFEDDVQFERTMRRLTGR